jgi:phage head maturation protease
MPPKISPQKNEAKQDFLKRCVAKRLEDGSSETGAVSACAADWNAHRLAAQDAVGHLVQSAPVQLLEVDPAAADAPAAKPRFAILAYTGSSVDCWDGRKVIDLKGMVLSKTKVPALRSHDNECIVGIVDQYQVDANGFHVSGSFSEISEDGVEVLGLALEGFPWQASVGIRMRERTQISAGQEKLVNGKLVSGPAEIWTKSEVFEVSFCPFGADSNTAAIALSLGENNNLEDHRMSKKLRKILEGMGLSAQANEQEALAFLDQKLGMTIEGAETLLSADMGAPAQGKVASAAAEIPQGGASGAVAQPDESQLHAARKEGVLLLERGKALGLADEVILAIGRKNISTEDATRELFAAAAKKPENGAIGTHIEMGADESDKVRLAAVDGMLLQMGHQIEKPSPGSREFRGMTLSGLLRFCLIRSGGRGKVEFLNNDALYDRFLADTPQGQSSSDFPNILRDAINKHMLKAYLDQPSTWQPFCNITDATDFKTIYGVTLSDLPSLDLIGENGEYKMAALGDSTQSYSVATFGKMVPLSRKMIVNDDMRAFQRLPALFGAAASRKASDIVYGLITGNPNMADGVALFHANHNNLEATSKGTIDKAKLASARAAMRKQQGPNGSMLDITPRFVLAPVAQQTDAEILLLSSTLSDTNRPAGIPNPFMGIQPICDPRLDANSAVAWYLVGDPNTWDTIEVAYLNGNREPYIEERPTMSGDGMLWKVRFDFGAGLMSSSGFFKNPGV